MIYVTEKAKQELKSLLDKKVNWPGARLRLLDKGQGKLGLGIDIERPDDVVLEYEDTKLMVVEPGLAFNLANIKLDVEDTDSGPELILVEEVDKQSMEIDAVKWMPLSPGKTCQN